MRYMINTYGNVDLGTLDWNKEGLNFYTISISNNIKKPKDDNTIANIYCNLYRAVPLSASFVEGDMAVGTHGYLYIRNTRYTTTAEFKEAMRGQILRYELKTPANGGYLPMYKGRYKVSNVCQFIKPNLFYNPTVAGLTITSNGDTFTVNGTSTEKTSIGTDIKSWTPIIGHKILVSGCPEGGGANTFRLGAFNQRDAFDSGNGAIGSVITTGNWFGIVFESGVTFNNLVFKPQLFDLTEMYGAGNEPTTVEQFRQDFPNDLYPYSPYCWVNMKQLRYLTTTKNLFDIPLTQGYPSNNSWTNDTARTFTFGTYIIGITVSNYYIPSNVADVNISKNSIHFNIKGSYYGVAMPYYLTVGNTYTVSCKADNNFHPLIGISYYKEDGTFISFTQSEVITNNPVLSFTVPDDTYYTLILFSGRSGNEYTFSNIQLEEGSTATPYVPYGYLSLK